jgi:hypothetical protein
MIRTKYLNIDTRFYASKCGFAEYYVELPQCIRGVTSLSIATVELPIIEYNWVDLSNNNRCYDTRYVYLEIIEYEFNKHNNHLFTSSILGSQISKYIIGRIVLDYKNYPIGSILPANLSNGLLTTTTRIYKKPITLENMKIRLVNEFGAPIFLDGLDFSFCIQLECDSAI